MATTPNFGWSTPDNTGLVKNGALDIRTLGNSIDASLLDLKGGTTGQVLTKASNTDMDFSWVADATGIPATIVDAKGDLIAATAADTVSRLAVGTNGQVLTADSTAATGIKWASPASGGGMTVIASGSLSGTSLNLTSISSSYKNLQLVLRDWFMGSSGNLTLNLNGISATNAYTQINQTYAGSATNSGGNFNDSYLTFASTRATDDNNSSVINIMDYTNTSSVKLISYQTSYFNSTGVYTLDQGSIVWRSTPAAVNRIEIANTVGSFSGGTYILYGVN